MRFGCVLGVSALFFSLPAGAEPLDPGGARTQLQQGYALKEQGKCEDAIAHFVESVRLDRQPKALLNLADCEEKVGKYIAAQTHVVEARDLARAQGAEALRKVAEQRLVGLEKKMPRMVVKLAKDAPSGTVISRDGIELGAVSLGTALPVDPGPHTVLARSPDLERRYAVTLVDGATQEIEVTPVGGKPIGPSPSGPATSASEPSAQLKALGEEPPPATGEPATKTAVPVVPIALGVVGVAGGVVATIWGLKAKSKFSEAETTCPASGCFEPEYTIAADQRADAGAARTVAIVAGVAGGAALASGLVVWLLGKPQASAPSARVLPVFGNDRAGIELGGSW